MSRAVRKPVYVAKPGPYFIVVAGLDYDYGEAGAVEHVTVDGVVGPFATYEEANAFPTQTFDRYEIVRMTAPDKMDSFYENKWIWEDPS